jgi:hypothetical protein
MVALNPFTLTLLPARHRGRFAISLVLLSLLAHVIVLNWFNSELQRSELGASDEDSVLMVALASPPQPAVPKKIAPPPEPLEPPDPPKPAEPNEPVAAVPVSEAPVPALPLAAVPEMTPDASAATPSAEGPESGQGLGSVSGQSEPEAATAPSAPAALFERISLPPSAELSYSVEGVRNGGRVSGHGKVRWQQDGQNYQLSGEVGALIFTLLDYRSQGALSTQGLLPLSYSEKRIGRSQTNTHFQRERQTISFSASTEIHPVRGGEQDKASWIWQIASLGRGDPEKFEAGLVFELKVAGNKTLEYWRVYVNGREAIEIADATLSAWRITVIPGANSFEKQFDLWLAPEREWYPVRLRHTDKNGNSVDMRLKKVIMQASAQAVQNASPKPSEELE